MNLGRRALRPDLFDESMKEQVAWQKIREVENTLDWNISEEIDSVRYDPQLSYEGKEAQTRRKPNGEIEVVFGDHFFETPGIPDYLKDIKQTRTALHEMIHVSDFAGRIEDDLRGWNADEHFISEFSTDPVYRPESETEALTEITVDELLEEDIGSAYPYWKSRKERELSRRGVEAELDPGSDQQDPVVERYDLGEMNVLYQEEGKNFYRQMGEIDGDFYMIEIQYDPDLDIYEEEPDISYRDVIKDAIQITNEYIDSLQGVVGGIGSGSPSTGSYAPQ